ncbi:colanic acid biosynthesis glycosyl transferase WcaI [Clavibacter sp. B3I6]|uniref:glycosyltransferase family 4 protein n=1 Tax=Clavibacter sp. B3I6 TaxID=3042268 RepID=UPI00278677C2|nr:glycosyltransferase family 4 protein [Clavibacter sp. B3I6]MDQ0743123.1 colanic acid biosynthesis glycosyl transferase WcaI [Clavibacter sp. B3I6]
MGEVSNADIARTRTGPDLTGLSVCVIGIDYWPETTGIAPHTTAMAEALIGAGASVHVITGSPRHAQRRLQEEHVAGGRWWEEMRDGVRITRIRRSTPEPPELVGRGELDSSFLRGALREVRRDTSDVVIAVTPSLGGLVAGALGRGGRPFGVVVQDLTADAAADPGTTGSRASRLVARAESSLLRRADRVGVVTSTLGDRLIDQGVDQQCISVLPNSTPLASADISTAAARTRLGWARDAFTVIHTGDMGVERGLESVVEAARLSDARDLGIEFVLAGVGDQRVALEALGAGIRSLRFVQPIAGDDYPYALAAADALLLSESPGMGATSMPGELVSYVSCKRPIIAAVEAAGTTASAVREHETAAIIPPGNPERLLQAALHMRWHAEQAARLSTATRRMLQSRAAPVSAHARYVRFAQALSDGGSGRESVTRPAPTSAPRRPSGRSSS